MFRLFSLRYTYRPTAPARMDSAGNVWHFSGMEHVSQIPVFSLFGESGAFPDVVHCERILDRARLHDWQISPHRHREIAQIFFMQQGAAHLRVDGVRTRLGDESFQFIPARAVHDLDIAQGSEGLVLSFPLPVVSALRGDGLERRLAAPFAARADARLGMLADQIAATFAGTGPYRGAVLVGLSQAMLAAAAEIAARGAEAVEPLHQRRMPQFERLIAAHLGDGWTAAHYAAALSITPGHLNRICRAATGTSASQHIDIARMTEARRLLAFTLLPVAEIGYRLGFPDPAYFSRRFRAATGESPSVYRERFR